HPRRVFPFGHPRIKFWLATPRGFSQPPTSFIASRHQGIHHTPFVAWLPDPLSAATRPSGPDRTPRSRSSSWTSTHSKSNVPSFVCGCQRSRNEQDDTSLKTE